MRLFPICVGLVAPHFCCLLAITYSVANQGNQAQILEALQNKLIAD